MVKNGSLRLILALLAATTLAAAKDNPADVTAQQKFRAGASVRMHLESGDYTITGTDSENIVVTYRAGTLEQTREVKVNIAAKDSVAELSIRHTPNNNFHAEIEIPRQSNLWVRLTAGDLTIQQVEGNKDVEVNAGDVSIEIQHPEKYGHVDGSVVAGDVDASAFNISKSGLFRSFHYQGKGSYRLHAHLLAGDLMLRESD